MSIIAGILLFMLWTWPCSLPKDLPGPRRFWYLPWGLNGILEVASNFETMLEYCVNANKLYGGGTWAVQMPKVGIIRGGLFFLTEPASVKHVLKDNFENYVKGEAIHDALSEFLGDGIFVADGPMWKFHRKVQVFNMTAYPNLCTIPPHSHLPLNPSPSSDSQRGRASLNRIYILLVCTDPLSALAPQTSIG